MTWEDAEAEVPSFSQSAKEIFQEFKATGIFTPEECLAVAKEEANAECRVMLARLRRQKERVI